jgi:hypothetical protein
MKWLSTVAVLITICAGNCDADNSSPPDAGINNMPTPGPNGDLAERDAGVPADGAAVTDAAVACVPDLMAAMKCGRCGTSITTCVAGQVTMGACTGEGACTPGDAVMTMDGCEVRTCSTSCQWGLWGLKPGAACAVGFVQNCDAGLSCPVSGKQQCLKTCQWGPCLCP